MLCMQEVVAGRKRGFAATVSQESWLRIAQRAGHASLRRRGSVCVCVCVCCAMCVCVCVYVCLCAKIWVPTSMGPFGRLFFDKLFEFHCIKCCQVLLSEDTVLSIHGYDSISTFDLLGLGSSEVPFPDARSHNLLL